MTLFYAKFAPSGPNAPDRLESLEHGIPKGLVMSRNNDGSTLSVFGDDTWDMRNYGANSPWSFTSWHVGEKDDYLYQTLKEEIKTAFWLVCFNSQVASDRATNSYVKDLVMLRKLAKLCHRVGVSFGEAADSSQFQAALRASIVSMAEGGETLSGYTAGSISHRLNHFHAMHHNPDVARHVNVPLFVPEADLQDVCAIAHKVQLEVVRNQKQTPLIPTRILANLLTGIEKRLADLEPHLDNILQFAKALRNPAYWCSNSQQYTSNRRRIGHSGRWCDAEPYAVGRKETLELFGLSEWAANLELLESPNLNAIKAYLKTSQLMASILVHAYTGMRHSEVIVMPYLAYVEHDIPHFGKAGFIISHLKKFAGDNYSDTLLWATGGLAKRAVQAAQKITRIFWAMNSDDPFPEGHAPLWLAHDWAPIRSRILYPWPLSSIQHYGQVGNTPYNYLDSIQGLTIEQTDMNELMMFDAFRDWEEDPRFEVGKMWPLSTHQFRRSVAVYASRSGMVSLPSLSTQYKHLSKVMTALYAENSSFAASFVGEHGRPKDGYGVLIDFQTSKSFNASVSFHERVIKAKSRLSGGRGAEIQLRKDSDRLPKIMESREATEKAIRQGKMAYRETIVGGCMRKDYCEHYGVDEILPCVFKCPDAVIGGDDGAKLQAYAEGLGMGMEEMDENSLAYKTTKRELERIEVKLLEMKGEL